MLRNIVIVMYLIVLIYKMYNAASNLTTHRDFGDKNGVNGDVGNRDKTLKEILISIILCYHKE